MQRIVVLGAGYVGGYAADCLAAEGHDVTAVRRTPSVTLPGGVRWVPADAGSAEQALAAAGVTAADSILVTIAPSGADGYEVYEKGARAGVALAGRLGARRLVYTSSSGVYAEREGGFVDEDSPLDTVTPRGRALVAAESALLDGAPCAVAVLRLTGIYGPGRNPVYRYEEASVLPQGGFYFTNRVRLEDILGAIRLVLDLEPPPPKLVANVTDDEPAFAAEISSWITEQRGRKFTGGTVNASTAGPAPPSRRIRNDRLRALGWEPLFPTYREGFAGLL